MLPFKTNVKIFIIEFACAVLMETLYAISMYGIQTAGLVSLGFIPAMIMFFVAYKVDNRNIIIRCLYMSSIFTFFFLTYLVKNQSTLPFTFLVMAVALALFLTPNMLLEYLIVTVVILIGTGIVQITLTDSGMDFRLYIDYLMMYAFAGVALQFIVVGVQNYKREMEEKNELAKEALEAKSNFLANMSHEIRTPMNAIYGMAELLGEKDFSSQDREYISTIKRSSENLLSIINEILDFSKVDSGKMTISEEPYDFNNMVQDVVSIIEFRLREKNIVFETKVNPSIPKELIGDELRMRQILINLLNNAVKFTNRGTITLKMDWNYIEQKKGLLHIEVRDTGIGISEENLNKLFEAFGQLDTKKNRNVEGTGLGLAITKKIVDIMGGRIHVESVIKEGSNFIVDVPQKVYDAEPSKFDMNYERTTYDDNFRVSMSAPNAKVLIVDDNKVNRQVAGELMKLFGIEAYMAESGQEAIDKVEKRLITYDVIFMDHMMPFMDGVEATKIIRGLDSDYAKSVPIVALSANAIQGVAQMFLDNGMNDYLSKPIKMETLNAILSKWIPRTKQYPPGTTAEDVKKMKKDIDYTQLTPDEIMEHLEGIDVQTGIKNCAGNVEIYFDLLQTYATSNLANVLNDFLEKEDLVNYAVTAHSIKGASRNIGAHDVADLAYSLERAGERQDIKYIWDNHDELVEEYTGLMRMLKRIFFNHG